MARQECGRFPTTCIPELLDPPVKANAAVMPIAELFGEKQKMNIFVYSRPFEENENFLSIVVSRHEATHACDVYHGIRTRGRTYARKELEGVYPDVLVAVLEVRASGFILKTATTVQWDDPNILAQLPNFSEFWDDLELYSTVYKSGNRSSLIMDTLEEFGDVNKAIKAKVESEKRKAETRGKDRK